MKYIVTYRSASEQPLIDACTARIASVDPDAHVDTVMMEDKNVFTTMMSVLRTVEGIGYADTVTVLHPCVAIGQARKPVKACSVSWSPSTDEADMAFEACRTSNCIYRMNGTAVRVMTSDTVIGTAGGEAVLKAMGRVYDIMQALYDASKAKLITSVRQPAVPEARVYMVDMTLRGPAGATINVGSPQLVEAIRKSKLDVPGMLARIMETVTYEAKEVPYHGR